MTSIIASIQPKWCELIASGKKTIEVRKTAPKEVPFKCYIYCTDGFCSPSGEAFSRGWRKQVIGEFVCDKVFYWSPYIHDDDTITLEEISDLSCVDEDTLVKYADGRYLKVFKISNLVIYDKPKKLSEFRTPWKKPRKDSTCTVSHIISRPPQSWMYCEEVRK